jgi:hypothetical protein
MNLTHITPPPYFDDNGVALEERCKTCQGYGYMQAGAWHVYTEAFGEAERNGFGGNREEWEAMHPMPEMNEEEACGDCEGSGYTLTTRGLALLDFLRRHGFGGRP